VKEKKGKDDRKAERKKALAQENAPPEPDSSEDERERAEVSTLMVNHAR